MAISQVPDRPAATLNDILETLGPAVVEVLAAPRGLDVPLGQPVIDDPLATDAHLEAGDVLFAVGTQADSAAAAELVRRAGRAGAGAVAFKLTCPAPEALLDAAVHAGVAVLAVPREIAWLQFHTLLRTAMAGTGRSPMPEVAGVAIGDLFSLANAVAAMAGGPVTIEDPQSRVLAYSTLDEPIDEPRRQTILGRRIPEAWMQRLREAGFFRRLWTSEDVVHYDAGGAEGLKPRIAIAVRAGGEILGSIWLAEGRTPLSRQAEDVLRVTAPIAALHLIRSRSVEDVERRMRSDLVRSVLSGRGARDVMASRLGFEPDVSCAVLAFEIQSDDQAHVALHHERVLDLVSVYCEAFRRRSASAALSGIVYVLMPAARDGSGRVLDLAHEVVRRAEASLGLVLHGGVGSVVPDVTGAPRSKAEAEQVLRVLKGDRLGRRAADIDEVRAAAVLLELRDVAAERPHMHSGKVQVLSEHDARRGTSHVATLRAYLESLGDIPGAARRMGVHPNTFRYRLQRLAHVAGLDLTDPDEVLAAWLQLRLG